MVTAYAHSEPVRVKRHERRREPRNLARYLSRHAGPLPKIPPVGSPQLRAAHESQILASARNPYQQQTLRELLKVWGATRGYFPGRKMPVPRFGGPTDFDEGAVGYPRNPAGDPVATGVQFGRGTMRMLTHPRDQFERDLALQTVLHEWAHNFQAPRLHRSRAKIDPVREGGAEGFAHAVAPAIAQALGRRYVGKGGVGFENEYRPFVRRLLREKPVSYFTRGQFGA